MAYDGTYYGREADMRATETVLNLASAARTTNSDSGEQFVGIYGELAVDVNISAVSGTTPSMTLYVDRKGADGNFYTIYTSAAQNAAGNVSTSIGVGAATNASFGDIVRLRWVITGTTPSFTFTASIKGK
jgi:hypothetical protein